MPIPQRLAEYALLFVIAFVGTWMVMRESRWSWPKAIALFLGMFIGMWVVVTLTVQYGSRIAAENERHSGSNTSG